jgi:hypothetical protein
MTTMRDLIRSLGGGSLPTRRPDQQYIAGYAFPPGMLGRALTRCPPSVTEDVLDVGLRQFFLAAAADPDLRASMPSRVVDEAWHEFITFTRAYEQFCLRAFGRFLHHEPEYLMDSDEATANQTTVLWGTWQTACYFAGLDAEATAEAPVLFSADHDAHLDGARRYVATCGAEGACTAPDGVACVQHELRGAAEGGSGQNRRRARRGGGSVGSWAPFVGGGCSANGCGGSSCGSGCGGGGCGGGS